MQLDLKTCGATHRFRYLRLVISQQRHGDSYTVYSQPLHLRTPGVSIPNGSKDTDYENRDWLLTKTCNTTASCTVFPAEAIGLFNTATALGRVGAAFPWSPSPSGR